MRILVATTVHHPLDARLRRLTLALIEAGHRVTLAAPFAAFRVSAPPQVTGVDLPRSAGRRRLRAIVAARRVLHSLGGLHDVVIVADPELTLVAPGLRHSCVIWDVQEDTAAALTLKPWLPAALRAPAAAAVRRLERAAEASMHLVLAEEAYAERFARTHPVVPNSTWVPASVTPAGPGRAVYVGHLSIARGALDMLRVADLLRGEVVVHLVGAADGQTKERIMRAHADGLVIWHGFLPNDAAMAVIEGATAGLSLLRDEANYRHSRPTKILEYLAHGVPAVSTPLPEATALIQRSGGGLVVPFGDPPAAADAIRRLHVDAGLRAAIATSGHSWVLEHFDWSRDGRDWVRQVEDWARRPGP